MIPRLIHFEILSRSSWIILYFDFLFLILFYAFKSNKNQSRERKNSRFYAGRDQGIY